MRNKLCSQRRYEYVAFKCCDVLAGAQDCLGRDKKPEITAMKNGSTIQSSEHELNIFTVFQIFEQRTFVSNPRKNP